MSRIRGRVSPQSAMTKSGNATVRAEGIRCGGVFRAMMLALALVFAGVLSHGALAQEGTGNSGALKGEGISLEWQVSGAEVGTRFFADRTWQARGKITSTSVRFSGVMRSSVPAGTATHSGMKAYISLPMGRNKQDKDWNGELSSATGLSHELPFDFTLDVPPNTPVIVSAGVNKVGGGTSLLAVTFQFDPQPKPVAENPNDPIWVWVRQPQPRPPFASKAFEPPSTYSGSDGAVFLKSYWAGGGTNASPLTFSAVGRWKMPLWLKAGAPVPIDLSIQKAFYKQHDTEPGMRGYMMSMALSLRGSAPRADGSKAYETLATLNKSMFDGSPDLFAPAPVKTSVALTPPAYAKDLEGKYFYVAVVAAGGAGTPEVWFEYQYYLRQGYWPPPEPPVPADPEDPSSPCAGKTAEQRAALLAAGRRMYFEGLYHWLNRVTESNLWKLWGLWDNAKSEFGFDAAVLGDKTALTWVTTGTSAAAGVLATGLTALVIEDRLKNGLRALDRELVGDQLIAGLERTYLAYAANWKVIDSKPDYASRQAELETLGKIFYQEHLRYGVKNSYGGATAGYEMNWRRSGSDMSFAGHLMARLYELHLAEKEIGCL